MTNEEGAGNLYLSRNQSDPEAFLSSLKGGFQQVHDYLVEEVLATQPARVRDGLLKISLLDRFSATLVELLSVFKVLLNQGHTKQVTV